MASYMINWQKKFLIIFFIILILPLLLLGFFSEKNFNYIKNTEKRSPNKFPDLISDSKVNTSFGVGFERWLQDNIAFRPQFIKFYNKNFTKKSNRVLDGENGYLFYGRKESVDSYKRNIILSEQEIQQHLEPIIAIASKLQEQNIKFYWFIPPNKHSIYPEHFPKYIKRLDNASRLDQIIAYINKNKLDKLLHPIDIRDYLINSKIQYPDIYYKTDTHWNALGAFLGHKILLDQIKLSFDHIKEDLSIDDYDIKEDRMLGDLAKFSARNLKSNEYKFLPKFDYKVTNKTIGEAYITNNMNSSSKYKAVIYRDSFFTNLIPFVSVYFNEAQYINRKIKEEDITYIVEQKPDIVIYETVERLA